MVDSEVSGYREIHVRLLQLRSQSLVAVLGRSDASTTHAGLSATTRTAIFGDISIGHSVWRALSHQNGLFELLCSMSGIFI